MTGVASPPPLTRGFNGVFSDSSDDESSLLELLPFFLELTCGVDVLGVKIKDFDKRKKKFYNIR
jgi:hypothetical protein